MTIFSPLRNPLWRIHVLLGLHQLLWSPLEGAFKEVANYGQGVREILSRRILDRCPFFLLSTTSKTAPTRPYSSCMPLCPTISFQVSPCLFRLLSDTLRVARIPSIYGTVPKPRHSKYYDPEVTKDGVTVAKSIDLKWEPWVTGGLRFEAFMSFMGM